MTQAIQENTPPATAGAKTEQDIFELMFGFVPARVMIAAVQLDIFGALENGPRDVAAVAAHCKASERGIRMLTDSLVGMGLLGKSDGHYHLTPATAKLLVPSSPTYAGALIQRDVMWQNWGHLTDVVRTGEPLSHVDREETAVNFFPHLVKMLHVLNHPTAQTMAKHLAPQLARPHAAVLDVACGSGVWGIAVAEAYPEVRITAHDFPTLLDGLHVYLDRHGVADRFDHLAGDLKTVDFGEARFDVAILGNIVHSEGEASSRDLFARLHRALRPGGVVVVVDMIPSDDRTGPAYPLQFALNMLLHTTEGDTYTFAEYDAWLRAAGFDGVERVEVGSHSPLIVGHRR